MLPMQGDMLDSIEKGIDPVSNDETEINWPLIHNREKRELY